MDNVKMLPIDYVTKDYEGFLQMMKEAIPSLTSEWTDTSDTDQGIVILQLLSYGLHVLGYYQDKGVNESFLPTAKTKKAILLLCRFLGYTPSKQTAAYTDVVFTKRDYAISTDVLVPKGTKVSTNVQAGEPVIYETAENLYIPAGETEGTVLVIQGNSVYQEVVGKGNNLPDQKYYLNFPEVLEDTLEVITTENGRDFYWTLVENLFDSVPTDRHFMTTMDEEGRTWIIFGDGVTGMKPPNGINVFCNYRYGGGSVGNMPAQTITEVYDTVLEGIDSVTNPERASGGEDYESLEKAKMLAPMQYRSGDRIVTASDCEDQAMLLPGIVKAKAFETFDNFNNVNVYLADESYEPLTESRKAEIKAELQKKVIMNQRINIFSANFKLITLNIRIFTYGNFKMTDVQGEVDLAIREYLNPSLYNFGETIFLSKLVDVCFGIRGVRNAVVDLPVTDILLNETELPLLQSLTVTVTGGV